MSPTVVVGFVVLGIFLVTVFVFCIKKLFREFDAFFEEL